MSFEKTGLKNTRKSTRHWESMSGKENFKKFTFKLLLSHSLEIQLPNLYNATFLQLRQLFQFMIIGKRHLEGNERVYQNC